MVLSSQRREIVKSQALDTALSKTKFAAGWLSFLAVSQLCGLSGGTDEGPTEEPRKGPSTVF